MKVKKKVPINRLKKKAWKVLSEWVRKTHSGDNTCVTCGVMKPYKELHAGHYIHGHAKPTFLMAENVHPQCVKCNHFLSGNLLEYHDWMLKSYGQEFVDNLRTLSKGIWKPSRSELESVIEKYELALRAT